MSSDLGGINSVFLEDVFVKSTLSRYLDIITKLTLALPFSHAITYTPMHTHTWHSQIQDRLVFWMLKIKCPENVFQEDHYYFLLLSIIVKRNSASWGICNYKNISYAYYFHTLPTIYPITKRFMYGMWSVPTSQIHIKICQQQARALVSCIQPGLVICFTLDNIHVSMLFSRNIPPSPSPTESKSLFCTSVSLFLFCI